MISSEDNLKNKVIEQEYGEECPNGDKTDKNYSTLLTAFYNLQNCKIAQRQRKVQSKN